MTIEPSPRRTLSVFLVMMSASTVFLDYWSYSVSFHATPDIWASTLRGDSAAPAQYRIGVLKAAEFLTLHSPLAMRHALALIDFIALLIAVFILRSLLTRSPTWNSAGIASKWFGAAAFVVLPGYSLAWISWYQRPETLTIAALLALSLWLCTHRFPPAGIAGNSAGLIVVAFLLGFIRADVAITFNVGIALVCLTRFGKNFALPRFAQLTASLAAAAAAGLTQLYIMRVLYPHVTYGTSPVFELVLNVTDHIRIVPFTLFIIPSAWAAVEVLRRRFDPDPAQAGLIIGAGIFVCLWCVLGKIDEVRIFLPFAFALAPLTVEVAMAHIAVAERATPSRNVS